MQHIVANSFEIDIDDTFPRVVNWHEVVTAKPFTQTVTSPEFSICTTESKAEGDAAARLEGEAARRVEGQEIVERRAFDADGLPGIHIAARTYPDGETEAPCHRHIVILVPPDPSFLYQAEATFGDEEAETTIKAFTAALASFRRRLPERSFAEILAARESEFQQAMERAAASRQAAQKAAQQAAPAPVPTVTENSLTVRSELFGRDMKVEIFLNDGQAAVDAKQIETLLDFVRLPPDLLPRIKDLLYADYRKAAAEIDYGADDPDDPFELPDADAAFAATDIRYLSISDTDRWQSRFSSLVLYPPWEQEHGVTLIFRNGEFLALSTQEAGYYHPYEAPLR
jgi:biotin carboxyl carrier protein